MLQCIHMKEISYNKKEIPNLCELGTIPNIFDTIFIRIIKKKRLTQYKSFLVK